jgi:hypothetical protein
LLHGVRRPLTRVLHGRIRLTVTVALFLLAGMPAVAGVIDVANVTIGASQFRAFKDQTTDRTWLDLDNFFTGYSYNSVEALLVGSGFHIATYDEVLALEASIPAVPANFAAEAAIIGANYPGSPHALGLRSLMWGVYASAGTEVYYAYRYGGDTNWWSNGASIGKADLLSVENPQEQDLGAWVVADAASGVPEPGTFGLLAAGLGVAALRRRMRA